MSSKRRRSSCSPLRDRLRIDMILKDLLARSTVFPPPPQLPSSSLSIIGEEPAQPDIIALNNQNLPCSSRLKSIDLPTFEHLDLDMQPKNVERKFFEDLRVGDQLYARVFRVGYVELTVQLIATLQRYRRCFCRLRKFKFNVPYDSTTQNYKVDEMIGGISTWDEIRLNAFSIGIIRQLEFFIIVTIKSINLSEKQLELILNEQAIFPIDIKPFYCSCQYSSSIIQKSYTENELIRRMLKNPYLDSAIKISLDCETSAIESIHGSMKNCRIENAKELRAIQTQKRLVDLISKASDFTRAGQYQMAISIFSKALNIDDKCADAYCGRGAANAGNKNLYGALSDLNKAIEIDPKHVNANKYRQAVMIAHAKNLENDETTKKEAQKLFREAWENSGRKNQEALNGLKRLDEELIQCIDLSQDVGIDLNGLNASSSSSSHQRSKKRSSTQMALEDAKKLNDIEKYIKSLKKK